MNGTMAFMDVRVLHSRLLEMPVNIAGVDIQAMGLGVSPTSEYVKTGMWQGIAVQPQSMAIEAPGELRVAAKSRRVGDFIKGYGLLAQGRIGFPETFTAAKIRQTRIYTHARTSRYHQAVCLVYQFCCVMDEMSREHEECPFRREQVFTSITVPFLLYSGKPAWKIVIKV